MFQDEAAFRLEPTLFQTWSRVGHQPQILSLGQKKTQHVMGAIQIPDGHFFYRFTDVCNGSSFRSFLGGLMTAYYPQKVFLVLDNARFHKEPGVISLCQRHLQQIELWFLPVYSPELNAAEPIWGYTRREATHNRYFLHKEELITTVKKTFRDIQYHPEKIHNLIAPYN